MGRQNRRPYPDTKSFVKSTLRAVVLRLIGSLLAANLGGCGMWTEFSGGSMPAASDQAPALQSRPPIETEVAFETVTIEIEIPLRREVLKDWFDRTGAASFNSYLAGTAAVPGVARVEEIGGKWSRIGDRRRVVFADNNSAIEEITDLKPDLIEYEVWKLTSRTGRYITYAVSRLVFQEEGMLTRVRWTYSFRPLVPIDGWLIRSYVQNDFRQFMEAGLGAMQTAAISEAATRPRRPQLSKSGRA